MPRVKAVLPVDEGAAVYHCEARLDGRIITTHCMEKKKAERVYKEAVDAGKTAVLTAEDEDTSDILNLNLGNLPSESRAELIIKLVMELSVQADGSISFVLPTVLNPRYAPEGHTHKTAAPHSYGGFWRPLGGMERTVHVSRPYVMEVKGEVRGNHEIARVTSHTDPINVTLSDDATSAQIGQDGGYTSNHDWSLLVYYKNPYQPHLLRETGDRAATAIMKDDLLMLNLFPEVPADSYSSRNEIIFVIDRSGAIVGSIWVSSTPSSQVEPVGEPI
ncbi:von Willebrand factor A domain-containing protein 5A [Chionoecetes opilio]|uniref:von Willebrand factor A domain-containing protein 5A n=1 Tax=Chionoecetes opilio TaxID=41210 RepID=A0A8J5CR88_CHIOP|nr:von Willebrand factor A domain-containing protein 5A [Chionoecetes opilio]